MYVDNLKFVSVVRFNAIHCGAKAVFCRILYVLGKSEIGNGTLCHIIYDTQ